MLAHGNKGHPTLSERFKNNPAFKHHQNARVASFLFRPYALLMAVPVDHTVHALFVFTQIEGRTIISDFGPPVEPDFSVDQEYLHIR